jgi:hypothetical protein
MGLTLPGLRRSKSHVLWGSHYPAYGVPNHIFYYSSGRRKTLLPFVSIYDWQKCRKISYVKREARYEEKKSHKNSVRCSTDACGAPVWFTAPLAWAPHMSFEEKTQ